MRSVLIILLLSATLAGCFGSDGPRQLSQEDAEDVARDALQDFADDFASPDGGDLRAVSGEFSTPQQGGMAHIDMEWGAEGTAHVGVRLGDDEQATRADIYCSQNEVVLILGGASLEARPRPGQSCLNAVQETGDPLNTDQLGEAELDEVVANPDGTVRASFTDDNGTVRITIDAKGRLERIDIEAPQSSGFLDVDYGTRSVIDMPDADDRMPMVLFASGFFDGEAFVWSAPEGNESNPYDEFEVRVLDSGETVATFTPGADGEENGFSFTWQDDGDGEFGHDDRFIIESAAWTEAGQYDVQVWDLWADREVDDVPIPGIGLWAIAAIALAGLLRRRS